MVMVVWVKLVSLWFCIMVDMLVVICSGIVTVGLNDGMLGLEVLPSRLVTVDVGKIVVVRSGLIVRLLVVIGSLGATDIRFRVTTCG